MEKCFSNSRMAMKPPGALVQTDSWTLDSEILISGVRPVILHFYHAPR